MIALKQAMGRCLPPLPRRPLGQRGQVFLEFILLLLVVVISVSVMKTYLNKTTSKLWLGLAKKIAAPCSSCAVDDPGEF